MGGVPCDLELIVGAGATLYEPRIVSSHSGPSVSCELQTHRVPWKIRATPIIVQFAKLKSNLDSRTFD